MWCGCGSGSGCSMVLVTVIAQDHPPYVSQTCRETGRVISWGLVILLDGAEAKYANVQKSYSRRHMKGERKERRRKKKEERNKEDKRKGGRRKGRGRRAAERNSLSNGRKWVYIRRPIQIGLWINIQGSCDGEGH